MTVERCERCGHEEALKFSLCLVNVDADAFEEGCHTADVDIVLCSDCEEVVADELLDIKQQHMESHA